MELAGTSAIVTGAASGPRRGHRGRTDPQRRHRHRPRPGVGLGTRRSAGDGVTAIAGDVTDADDVAGAVDAATASGAPLRMAVNCAGVGWASRILSKKGVHDYDLFRTVIGINLIGTFNVLRLAAAAIAETDPVDDAGQRGLIVNTASVAAFDGQIGQIAYAASKGGVAAMTLPAARDLAQFGIRVMTIAPGILDTPMMAGDHRGVPQQPGRRSAVPEAPRPARRVRRDGAVDRRAGLPQRRGDPAGRRAADGAALTRRACRRGGPIRTSATPRGASARGGSGPVDLHSAHSGVQPQPQDRRVGTVGHVALLDRAGADPGAAVDVDPGPRSAPRP